MEIDYDSLPLIAGLDGFLTTASKRHDTKLQTAEQ